MTRRRFSRRQPGTCQDCGHERAVRYVVFWLNGYRMRLCATCERVYERVYVRGQRAQPEYRA